MLLSYWFLVDGEMEASLACANWWYYNIIAPLWTRNKVVRRHVNIQSDWTPYIFHVEFFFIYSFCSARYTTEKEKIVNIPFECGPALGQDGREDFLHPSILDSTNVSLKLWNSLEFSTWNERRNDINRKIYVPSVLRKTVAGSEYIFYHVYLLIALLRQSVCTVHNGI